MRDRLIELLNNAVSAEYSGDEIVKSELDVSDEEINSIANYLLDNGVIVLPFKTNYAKLYSQVEEKMTIIHKLSGMTLDEIIEKLAKGYEFVPPKPSKTLVEVLEELEGGESDG